MKNGQLTESQVKAIKQFSSSNIVSENYPCICGKIGSDGDTLVSNKERYGFDLNIFICSKCGMIRPNPYYDEATLDAFYNGLYREVYDPNGDPSLIFPGQMERGSVYVRIIQDLDIQCKHILEVGCGAGGILVPFLSNGSICVGYDYNVEYLNYGASQNEGVSLKFGGLDDAVKNETQKYDLIIISHVLEHIPKPQFFLEKVAKLLNDEGVILIAVPSNKAIFNRSSYNFDFRWLIVNAHSWYFSENHLQYTVEKSGFNTIFLDDASKYHREDITGIFRLNNNKTSSQPKLKNLLSNHLRLLLLSKYLQFWPFVRFLKLYRSIEFRLNKFVRNKM